MTEPPHRLAGAQPREQPTQAERNKLRMDVGFVMAIAAFEYGLGPDDVADIFAAAAEDIASGGFEAYFAAAASRPSTDPTRASSD